MIIIGEDLDRVNAFGVRGRNSGLNGRRGATNCAQAVQHRFPRSDLAGGFESKYKGWAISSRSSGGGYRWSGGFSTGSLWDSLPSWPDLRTGG
jgi:hypothetical protein